MGFTLIVEGEAGVADVHVAGLLWQTILPIRKRTPPPVEYPGIYFDPPTWGGQCGMAVGMFDCEPTAVQCG